MLKSLDKYKQDPLIRHLVNMHENLNGQDAYGSFILNTESSYCSV